MAYRIFSWLIVFCTLFFGSCSEERRFPKTSTAQSEVQNTPTWLDDFVKEVLFSGPGIYTLFGDKPMSGYLAPRCRNLTLQERYPYLKLSPKKAKTTELEANHLPVYALWEEWERYKTRFSESPFLFRLEPLDHESQKLCINFINTREMAITLLKHYDTFKRELGRDFDPVKVTLKFEDLESDFWKDVFSNHLLMGLAYGFGARNSYMFSAMNKWRKTHDEDASNIPIFLSFMPKDYDINNHWRDEKIEHLRLPTFRSFPKEPSGDPVVEHYILERKRIQALLMGKNLTEEFLKRMEPKKRSDRSISHQRLHLN